MSGRARKLVIMQYDTRQRTCAVTAKPKRFRSVSGRTVGIYPSPTVDRRYMADVISHLSSMRHRLDVRNEWKAAC